MCRLFGFRSNVVSGAHRSLLDAENALSRQATQHRDGWGIGYFLGEEAYILKSESGAADDERFHRISRRLQSHAFVVHVRRATVGQADYLNSHPFRHGSFVFAHNGTIFGFEHFVDKMTAEVLPAYRDLIFGSTDSEHLFYYLLSALSRAGIPEGGRGEFDSSLAAKALTEALQRVYEWAAEADVEQPLMNFILTNGQLFFAQRLGIDLYLASQKVTCRDFDHCAEPDKICMEAAPCTLGELWASGKPAGQTRKVNHLTVASEPIGDENIWEMVPDGALVVVDKGLNLSLHGAPGGFISGRTPPSALHASEVA
jgi:predicted glutamine amidotransferase